MWAGRVPLAEGYGEATYYLQCARELARLTPHVRWLRAGRETREDCSALRERSIPTARPRVPWPPQRLVDLAGVPRVEWQYSAIDLLHLWTSKNAPPTRRPYVLTLLDGMALAGQFGESGDVAATRRLAHGARAVMTLTRESAALVADTLGVDAGALVPIGAGVDHERFSPRAAATDRAALQRHGFAQPYILYVGGWAPRKGLATLAEALAALALRDRPTVALTGKPRPDDAHLVATFERLGARVLGYVAGSDMAALLRGARAVVLPTRAEGFGLPVVEAQASGVPVVASDLPVIRSVSGGHAALVPPGDAIALARALTSVAGDTEQLVAAGIANARRHTWGAVAQRVLSVYQRAWRLPETQRARAA